MKIYNENISEKDKKIISELLAQVRNDPLEETDVWKLVNLVWNEIGCDARNPDPRKMNEFYNHPVWIINGLFIENHSLSMQHRTSIADWIHKRKLRKVLDYGGGIGTMATLIARDDAETLVDIYEPYPSDFARSRIKEYENIRFVGACEELYDCVLSIDVLEHVKEPLSELFMIAETVKVGGFLIAANCFLPVVKCHLPSSFHLRYSFDFFAKLMGFEKLGACEGSHAIIYQKEKAVKPNWWKIGAYEKLSRLMFPICKAAAYARRRVKG